MAPSLEGAVTYQTPYGESPPYVHSSLADVGGACGDSTPTNGHDGLVVVDYSPLRAPPTRALAAEPPSRLRGVGSSP